MNRVLKSASYVLFFALCVMAFGLTNVYAEEAINDVTVTGIKEPAVGAIVSDLISEIKVPEGANYTIDEIVWWQSENGMYYGTMNDDAIIEDNNCYYYSITLKANDGFTFPAGSEEDLLYAGNVTTSDIAYEDAYVDSDVYLTVFGEVYTLGDINYHVINGDGQTYVTGQANEATFEVDGDYSLFEEGRVYVDEEFLEPGQFTSEASSNGTVIKLDKTYTDSLTAGEHSIFIIFDDYKYAEATFTVVKSETTTEITPPNTGITANKNNPLFYVTMIALSAMAITGRFVLRKNNNY